MNHEHLQLLVTCGNTRRISGQPLRMRRSRYWIWNVRPGQTQHGLYEGGTGSTVGCAGWFIIGPLDNNERLFNHGV